LVRLPHPLPPANFLPALENEFFEEDLRGLGSFSTEEMNKG
jgi:hypothetical protein